jgi:GDPmannose 4,6-dehydratase
MLQQDTPKDYVISMNETHSVREFVEISADLLGMKIEWSGEGVNEIGVDINSGKKVIEISKEFYRPAPKNTSEVDLLLGNSALARKELNWTPNYSFKGLVEDMVESDLSLAKFELANNLI